MTDIETMIDSVKWHKSEVKHFSIFVFESIF